MKWLFVYRCRSCGEETVSDPLDSEIRFGVMAGIREADESPFVGLKWSTKSGDAGSLMLHPAVAERLGRSLLTAVAALKAEGHEVDPAAVRTTMGMGNPEA